MFQKWRWPCSHGPPKGRAVDKQAKDDSVHLGRFRKADRLADQAFKACSYGQMFALDFLRVAFAWAMDVGVQMPGVGAPIIGGVAHEPEGLK